MNPTDWQEALGALRGTLPQDTQTEQETVQTEQKSNSATRLDIILEKKGRAGKQATIICGFPADMPQEDIAALAARLKSSLGTGGSARGGEILIQGDRRADLGKLLEAAGFKSRII